MMKWLAAALLITLSVCEGAVVELKREDAAAVWNILRRTDAMSLVMVHDSTSPKSVSHRKLFEEASPSLELYADCYSIDISNREVSWIANALNVRISSQFLLFSTSLTHIKNPLGRPGGVKYPQTFEGILSAGALKTWLQQRIPDPKTLGMTTVTATSPTEIEEYVEKHSDEKLLVIVTDKDKVSPLLKSLIVGVNGDSKALLVKMASAKEAKLKKLPAITRYVNGERLVMSSDNINRHTVAEFMQKADVLEKLAADESQEMKTMIKKYLKPVTKITNQQEWNDEILDDNKGLVLVAFLDDSDSSHESSLKTLGEVAKQRTSLKSVNWVSTSQSYALLNHFGIEPGAILFISKKHGKWTRFAGAFTAKTITRFVEKSVAKGLGAKDLAELPEFGN
eukprot:TRINITY_DN7955_c0_g1_i1.p1 TRINITY_DN7955_c0_g1~~TRINITY_DN7955_c0_g1_i1.p1  ORF type:complete len:395 (+),score=102.82 TRINITY_DN7955_c0_g1_i1:147-1331(+)